MENKPPTRAEKALKLDYVNTNDIWLTDQQTLRKLVGVLGMLLPILLWTFVFAVSGRTSELPSISHYYYTRANGVFIIVVSLLAIFLIIYKGKQKLDFYLSAIAGLFALSLLLFPTGNLYQDCGDLCKPNIRAYGSTFIIENGPREIFHFTSAGIFLFCLAMMSLFVFTKSDKSKQDQTPQKHWRNRIYMVCGVMMISAMIVVALGGLKIISGDFYDRNNLTFWMEVVAVEFFGFSWLVKAEVILKD